MKPAMSITETSTAQTPVNHAVSTGRIASIDAFRGLTVLVMVFVDNLDFVQGLPWWTHHMPVGSNGMTYVDMVFPAFLFVMGVPIPLAVERRAATGDSHGRIWLHNVERSLSLVVLGLFIANAPQVDHQHAGISAVWWAILGFVGIALFWGVRCSPPPSKQLRWAMKYAGLLILAGLFIAFRRITPGGQVAWLDFSDWEILGLLGWAYLLVSSLYLLLKRIPAALTASLVMLSALNALSSVGCLGWLRRLPPYAQPFEAGLSSITMAGLIAGLIIIEGKIAGNFSRQDSLGFGLCIDSCGSRSFAGSPWNIQTAGHAGMVSVLCGGKHDRAPVPLLDFRCMLRGKEDQIGQSDRSKRPFGLHAGLCCLLQPDTVSSYRESRTLPAC
jgi:hypothetical protein